MIKNSCYKATVKMLVKWFILYSFTQEVFGRSNFYSRLTQQIQNPNFQTNGEIEYQNEQILPDVIKHLSSFSFDFKDYVEFFLYTKKNTDVYQHLFLDDVSSIKNSNFDTGHPTFFVIHGYMDNVNSEMVQSIKDGLLLESDCNVIAVDWSKITTDIFYHVIAAETPNVGAYIGTFVNFLIANGDSASNIHLIGHSLGAQAAGFAGKTVTSGKLKRISGLDPALPGFEGAGKSGRLDAGDADFVDCIHSCGGYLGYLDPICQADFYPNGGRNVQPGCLLIDFGVCSHGRSHEFFTESILPNHKFPSMKCNSVPSGDSSTGCTTSGALMGFPADKQYQGIFFTETNAAYPFSKNIAFNQLWTRRL